ncbi:MAG: cell division protein FtsB, partial [Gammaproteobacteria bacterium]
MLKPLTAILITLLVLLQYGLWAGGASFGKQALLADQVNIQQQENQRNQARNKVLFAEIAD